MSATVVLVPVIITAWPTLATAVITAAAAAGFHLTREEEEDGARKTTQIEINMENIDVVAESLSHDDKIVIQKGDVRVSFSRDARGRFKTCVDGTASKEQLRKIGEELAGKVVQQYVYNRLTSELVNQGFVTVQEEKGPDEAIRLHVRRYEG